MLTGGSVTSGIQEGQTEEGEGDKDPPSGPCTANDPQGAPV